MVAFIVKNEYCSCTGGLSPSRVWMPQLSTASSVIFSAREEQYLG